SLFPYTTLFRSVMIAPLGTAFGKAFISWNIQELHLGEIFQNVGNHPFIFLGRKSAGRIQHHSPWPEHGNPSGYNLFLETAEIFRPGRIPGFGNVRFLTEHALS